MPDGYAVTATRVGLHLHRAGADVATMLAELERVTPHRWRMRVTVARDVPVDVVRAFFANLPARDLADPAFLDLRGWPRMRPRQAVAVARERGEAGGTGAVIVPAAGLTWRPPETEHIKPVDAQGAVVEPDEATEFHFWPDVTEEFGHERLAEVHDFVVGFVLGVEVRAALATTHR